MNEESNNQNPEDATNSVVSVLNEIVDKSGPSTSQTPPPVGCQQVNSPNVTDQNPSGGGPTAGHNEAKSMYEIYRAAGVEFTDSLSDIELGFNQRSANKTQGRTPNLPALPPSYSTVIKQGQPSLDIRRDARSMEIQHINPFARVPPPSYAEIHGVWSTEMSTASSEQILFGPDPIYIWCSRCNTVVVTVTESQRSKFTHFTAVALCLFGCWPCAMLPYCMNSCKNTYHYCPDCNYLFGMYRPW